MSGLKLQNSGSPETDSAPSAEPPPIPPAAPPPAAGGGSGPGAPPPPPAAAQTGPSFAQAQPAQPPAPAPAKEIGFFGKVLVKVIAVLIINACAFGFWFFKNWNDDDYVDYDDLAEESFEDGTFDANGDWQPADVEESALKFSGLSADDVDWPIIVLTGMAAGNKEGDMTAILNGSLVYVNQKVEGARLIEVSHDGVVLEFEGTRKLIRIGEST